MAKHGEGEAWFGKTCSKCEAPINYAQAAKGAIPGLCGKCTDDVRRQILAERRSGQHRAWTDAPRSSRFLLGFVVGLFVAAAAAAGLLFWAHEWVVKNLL